MRQNKRKTLITTNIFFSGCLNFLFHFPILKRIKIYFILEIKLNKKCKTLDLKNTDVVISMHHILKEDDRIWIDNLSRWYRLIDSKCIYILLDRFNNFLVKLNISVNKKHPLISTILLCYLILFSKRFFLYNCVQLSNLINKLWFDVNINSSNTT